MITTHAKRYLPCLLNEYEKKERGISLANLNAALNEANDDKKKKASDAKHQIDGISASMNDMATAIRTGIERREVECHWSYDWKQGRKDLIRDDTGDVVETAVISETEKQMELKASE